MISIVILERAIRSAGAEEGRRRKREGGSADPDQRTERPLPLTAPVIPAALMACTAAA